MGTTTEEGSALRHPGNAAVFTESFRSALDTPDTHRKLVLVKCPKGLVDMFGRPYPRYVAVWVHHFDDYGVVVEGTYEVVLARRALKKAGYDIGLAGLWGWRPILVGQESPTGGFGGAVGGRSSVAFYFDVGSSL